MIPPDIETSAQEVPLAPELREERLDFVRKKWECLHNTDDIITTSIKIVDMKLWKECTTDEQKRLIQLMDDMIPYYERIAVYNVDKEFVRANREQCMSIALTARKLTTIQSINR